MAETWKEITVAGRVSAFMRLEDGQVIPNDPDNVEYGRLPKRNGVVDAIAATNEEYSAPRSAPVITGSRANANTLRSLYKALSDAGVIKDQTTA